MTDAAPQVVLCNGADMPEELGRQDINEPLRLEYRASVGGEQNVKVSLPDFVRGVFHLPDRILDLLEIAAYVFAADRRTSRGSKSALEYHRWARSFHFVVKVRDYEFWATSGARQKLIDALNFMTGDREYDFSFQSGHSTPPTGLFDSEEFETEPQANIGVVLFSGGLDSLAGVVERLETTNEQVCLVSHRSQPGMQRTQDRLFEALKTHYPGRLSHYKFQCSLKGVRAREETQRTRGFLYSAIAYALSHALSSSNEFFVYENGITSINFPKRQDMMNSRSSRTTHPRTIDLIESFFSEVEESRVRANTPFLWKTKTDVFKTLAGFGRDDLITSSVSCSKTFQNLGQATHCGGCSQCVDRRFGAYGAELDDVDESGIYALNFIEHKIDGEVKTVLIDYVRAAHYFATWNIDHFYTKMLDELVDLTDHIAGMMEEEAVERVWGLCSRHGQQVLEAIKRMRDVHDDLYREIPEGSFLHLVNRREYLQEPVLRLASDICQQLANALPITFRKNPPTNENDFNDKVSALVNTGGDRFEREHPAVRFALADAVPDHSRNGHDLLIESKYIRGATTPSRVSEGLAADLTKYPNEAHILFVVYDPGRSIFDDERFRTNFEQKGRCTVCIVR
jgi:hypothetical protein